MSVVAQSRLTLSSLLPCLFKHEEHDPAAPEHFECTDEA